MSAANEYDVGDVAILRGGFSSRPLTAAELLTFEATGALPAACGVDPDGVVCTVRKPDKTNVTPAVVREAAGVYKSEQELTDAGPWHYAFDGEGGFQASGERSLRVRAQRVPRP